ncbi:hypothetical protein PSOS111911_10280 [Pseudoalteromonas ostreae]
MEAASKKTITKQVVKKQQKTHKLGYGEKSDVEESDGK